MKYAIPVYEGHLSSHFGQSTEFLLLDVDANGRVTKRETLSVAPHSCGTLPEQLAAHGVGAVLAGGMGMGPRLAFQVNNVEVVLGVAETDPEKAAVSHFNRTLKAGQNVCEHGDTVCDHAGHHEEHHGGSH